MDYVTQLRGVSSEKGQVHHTLSYGLLGRVVDIVAFLGMLCRKIIPRRLPLLKKNMFKKNCNCLQKLDYLSYLNRIQLRNECSTSSSDSEEEIVDELLEMAVEFLA